MPGMATNLIPTPGRRVRRGILTGVITSVTRTDAVTLHGWSCIFTPDGGGSSGLWLGDDAEWSLE